MPNTPTPEFVRLPAVVARTSLSQSSIYRLMSAGQFPRPVKLGLSAVGWRVVDLDEWAASRPGAAVADNGPTNCTTSKHSRRKRAPAEAAAGAPA